ncbi:MAG TPA: 4Fe-4S dicluster domain-containing protein [Stellaceae bacterium]|nr:4Fe-4S dicluster domain-containing protein [Stellaceae bacterium]
MPPLTRRGPGLDRRLLLKLAAAAAAVSTTRCSPPDDEIIPYVDMPEGMVAGEPMRFATTLSLSGYGRGFIAIAVDGRPIKIEGNPRHPYSLGATDVFAEAEILSLYDPGRSSVVHHGEQIATWEDFAAGWEQAVGARPDDAASDAAVGLVTGRVVSPTTLGRIEALRRRFPALRQYRYEPVNDDMARAGAKLAFGRLVAAAPRWDEADVVLTLDADPLGHGPEQLHIARGFAARRGAEHRQQLHAVEPAWTLTGAAADFRLPLAPRQMGEVARAVARRLGLDLGDPVLSDPQRAFAERAAEALATAQGRALAMAGDGQPPELHALCHWINGRLHAPVDYLPPVDPVEAGHADELQALAEDLRAGRVAALVIVDANPVYDAPDALRMAEAVAAAPFSAHLGLYPDETAQHCQWRLPLSHPLESWGDARAADGTASLVQPLIRRLYDTRTCDEFLALLALSAVRDAYGLTRETWASWAGGDFATWWRTALHDGVIADSRAAPLALSPARPTGLPPPDAPHALTVVLSPDPGVWDGRFAANPWLQECPHPLTKQVWGNAVRLAPGDAARAGIADEDTVDLVVNGATLSGPAVVTEAQADGVVAVGWGQGRFSPAMPIAHGVGTRFVGLGARPFSRLLAGAEIKKSDRSIPFRSTQSHTRLSGRSEALFQLATLAELATSRPEREPAPPSMLGIPPRGDYAWAMVIDTDACIGCNACVVACQAENNVPIVGPEEISQGRDMHWLRVDVYARPQGGAMRTGFQPVPCMHCELAPCEPVCPVEASVHDHEGLNVQVYNRCIGTRFCEANCPYKVRRFNWFAYADGQAYGDFAPALKAQHNPDVSARGRGVMEKCNYCLQRISRARRAAEKEDRQVAEGEMVTACQAACPTRAIHFGDLNSETSDVSRLRRAPRHYRLLEELNTRPRTTYLKRLYVSDAAS